MSLPFFSPTSHVSSPLVEVVLRVVQPQANGHRVALPALGENVVHSSVPALSALDWGSLGTGESQGRGVNPELCPLPERSVRVGGGGLPLPPRLLEIREAVQGGGMVPGCVPWAPEKGGSARRRGWFGGRVP